MAAASLCDQVQRLHAEGRTEEAVEALRSVASRASPQDAHRLYMALAELEQARGKNREACRAWEAVVRIDPSNGVAWRGLAANASASGNEEAELLSLRALSEMERDKPDWMVCCGKLLAKRGATEEAKTYFRQALQLSPRCVSALIALAKITTGDEAMWLFEKAALAEPTATDALEGAAAARWAKGDFTVAGQWYRAVLNKRQDHPVALCRMAQLLLQEKNSQEALMLLTRATRREPLPPEALLWTAYIHLQNGHVSSAIPPLQAVVQKRTSNLHAQASLVLALALAELGDSSKAEDHFRIAAQTLPAAKQCVAADKDFPIDQLGAMFSKELPGASAKMLCHLEVLLQQYRGKHRQHQTEDTCSKSEDKKTPDLEASTNWRSELKEGQSVEVYSKSGKRWIPSTVLQLSREMVKVKYLIDGHWCEKVLLRDSEFLRLYQGLRALPGKAASEESKKEPASPVGTADPAKEQVGRIKDVGSQPQSSRRQSSLGASSSHQNLSASVSVLGFGSRTPRGVPTQSSPAAGFRTASMPRTNTSSALQGQSPPSRGASPLRSTASSASNFKVNKLSVSSTQTTMNSSTEAQSRRRNSSFTPRQPGDEKASQTSVGSGRQLRTSRNSIAVAPSASSQLQQERTPPSQGGGNNSQQRLPELLEPAGLKFGVVLGNGGFGAVYQGTYYGEEVAIKKMHLMDGKVTDDKVEEFKKEVRNLQTLRHPRLVRFIGAAYMAPTLCIVTEFMPNGSLYSLLHKRKVVLSRETQHRIAEQLCEGVEFLHSREPPFVHRDLKSLNIVLDHDLNAKLCDFGLTQTMEKTHITRRENEGGSPRYMAPELFDSKGKITEKVDVWALGCLVLEVFSGHMPHEECTSVQQVMMKLLVQGELPFSRWDSVPEQLHRIADLCFSFSPRQRADAVQVSEVLRSL